MDKKIEMLQDLLSGRIDTNEFRDRLSDELFKLRQDPTPTDDKNLLSRIQLFLHEFDEGNRDIRDVYIASQVALDSIGQPFTKFIHSKMSIIPRYASSGTVVLTSSSPPPDLSELPELQLV